jgi:beta-lactamase class A
LRVTGLLALASAIVAPAAASADSIERQFDKAFGTELRTPAPQVLLPQIRPSTIQPWSGPAAAPRSYSSGLEAQLASIAGSERGRIGVAAIDLATGRNIAVLGDQAFPLASTSKIAIVATFLQGVDDGRYRLSDQYPLMVPVASAKLSTAIAPVRAGQMVSAVGLIDLALIRSDNQATDALLAAVGGPQAVNRWLRMAGLTGLRLDRDIATLVRDDGVINPATSVDLRDSTTPQAMVRLLSGLHRGDWLSPSSRAVLFSAMERCVTGKRRIRGMLPEGARVAHKTGTLSNTASDVGFITTPDGRTIALAIYVTGQGGKPDRDARIASIARTIYDGYLAESPSLRRTASR